jgi:ubiquinone/menaquinone biosynthesis C-methylase UbiE
MQTNRVFAQQEINDYFESASEYWKEIYSDIRLIPRIYQDRHNTALDWISRLGLPADARILEVGCGAGQITVALARNGYTVDAVDPTTAMLQTTRTEAASRGVLDRTHLYLADVHQLPFASQTFELVIAIGVIPWLHSEVVALREMQRVLKHGGHLLLTADNNARLNRILDPISCPLLAPLRVTAKRLLQLCGSWPSDSRFQPKRHYPRELNRLIRKCNFKKVQSCTVGFGPFTFFGKELFTDPIGVGVHRQLQTLASRKGLSPLRWNGSHYMLLAEKVGV